MRSWLPVLGAGPVIALQLVAPPAGGVEPGPAAAELAYQRFEAGERAFAAGRFDEAAAAFREAFELHAEPAYLYNQALALAKGRRHVEALAAFDELLARFPASPKLGEIRRRRDEVVAAREKAKATIAVSTIPAAGRVELSTGQTCETPCELSVDPGPVVLVVSAGARSRQEARTLAASERWSVGYDLTPPPRPSADYTPSWVSWGIGAGAALLGTAFAISAEDSWSEGKRLAGESPLDDAELRRLSDLRSDVQSKSLIADIGFGVALVGVVVGTIFWATSDEPSEPEAIGVWRF